MSREAVAQTQQPTSHPLTSGGILQRQCVGCGQHAIAAGECEICKRKQVSPYPGQGSTTLMPLSSLKSPDRSDSKDSYLDRDFSYVPTTARSSIAPQTKPSIGQPQDKYEREADLIAAQVIRLPASSHITKPSPVNSSWSTVSSQTSLDEQKSEEEERKIQRKENSGQSLRFTHKFEAQLHSKRNKGQPLLARTRAFVEPRFGDHFNEVRVHFDGEAAQMSRALNAQAFTYRQNIFFGAGKYSPDSNTGKKLLAHELTHVIQQRSGSEQIIQKNGNGSSQVIEVEIIRSRDEYQPPGSREVYRVGDAAAASILMNIQERGSQVIFQVFNFETGRAEEMSPENWSFLRGAAIIGGSSNAGITRLGRQLSPSAWRALWPNPIPEVLRLFEAGQLALEDEALLSGYRGMIRSDAHRSLDENERTIDELLDAPDRVQRIQDYADGLREASIVRDVLIQKRDELSRRLVAQHSFSFFPHAGTGPDTAQRLEINRQRSEVDDSLSFWLSAFPLLTRLQTREIRTETVEAKLREIKANIISTRQELSRGQLDPMALDTVRARLADQLGPRSTAVVEAEDRSRTRWAIFGAVALTAATIGILFLPGGLFIDAAIGIAIAGHAMANAIALGRAANTGLHVDDGLVSQSQAQGARFAAVIATVFAVLGAAAAGFRVLRVGLALRQLNRSMPELALSQRATVARVLANDRELLRAFQRIEPGDTAISARVAAAVQHAGGDIRVLRSTLRDVAEIAAIPRRATTGPDLYEPLRRIVDGSDVERIASQTGFSRAEVEAAKRNLMLDEHILVDNATGALYRGRFEPFEEVASLWGRAARGEALTEAERQFMRRLIRHEQVEGAVLSGSRMSLERAFLRGELEGRLRTFLRSKGLEQTRIDQMLAVEPRPVTPYRYAHIWAHFSGAPNP